MTLRDDRGMATAEFAVAIPAFLVVFGLVMSAVSVGIDEIRCVDAAHVAARAAARGDAPDSVRALARRAAPPGALVQVTSPTVDSVEVAVRVRRSLWSGAPGPSVILSATAVAPRELPSAVVP